MDRSALAREWFDARQGLRNMIQAVKVDAVALGRLKPDSPFPRNIEADLRKMAARVAAFDGFVTAYCGSSEPEPAGK